jgi:hypothetical protein
VGKVDLDHAVRERSQDETITVVVCSSLIDWSKSLLHSAPIPYIHGAHCSFGASHKRAPNQILFSEHPCLYLAGEDHRPLPVPTLVRSLFDPLSERPRVPRLLLLHHYVHCLSYVRLCPLPRLPLPSPEAAAAVAVACASSCTRRDSLSNHSSNSCCC